MVRQWRNSDWVRPNMRYQAFVQPEEQRRWFEGLDRKCDWYFTARVKAVPFALFDVKGIDWTEGCGESGGFVGDPRFIGRPEPARATLALMDFTFQLLQLQSLQARYSSNLPRIVRFNEQLGYRIFREEDAGFVCARVSPERYFTCAASLRKAAATLHGNAAVLVSPDPWLMPLIERCRAAPFPDFQLEVA
jgi:RimJ/RimL family protein N-acetyltransferase